MIQKPSIRISTSSDLPNILYIINHAITTSTSNYRYDTINITDLHCWYEKRRMDPTSFFYLVDEKPMRRKRTIHMMFQCRIYSNKIIC